jgi:hypothetical protein
MNAAARDREIADLVHDLDRAIELLADAPLDLGSATLSPRERDAIIRTIEWAADFLHELRSAAP